MERVAQEHHESARPISATGGRLLRLRLRSERADPDLLRRVTSCLQGRGWVRRRELRAELGISDDKLREIARYSRGEIVGSSSHGYCLTREASVEEVGAVVGEWLSRSKQLKARVSEVLRVLHGRPRSKTDADIVDGAA